MTELTEKCILGILERVSSSQWVVKDAAMSALNCLTKANGFSDISELLTNHGDFLVHSIALKLRRMERNRRAPLVLAVTLDLCQSRSF